MQGAFVFSSRPGSLNVEVRKNELMGVISRGSFPKLSYAAYIAVRSMATPTYS